MQYGSVLQNYSGSKRCKWLTSINYFTLKLFKKPTYMLVHIFVYINTFENISLQLILEIKFNSPFDMLEFNFSLSCDRDFELGMIFIMEIKAQMKIFQHGLLVIRTWGNLKMPVAIQAKKAFLYLVQNLVLWCIFRVTSESDTICIFPVNI